MKAIKVYTVPVDWSKVERLLDRYRDDDDFFAARIDSCTFVAVFGSNELKWNFEATMQKMLSEDTEVYELK